LKEDKSLKGEISMTSEEAGRIFKEWQYYQEFHDKCFRIFMGSIPESFLPFPTRTLEEALNMVAKDHFDRGDKKTSDLIANSISFLSTYQDDAKAIESILFKLKEPKLRDVCLANLKKGRDSWLRHKTKLNELNILED
jgi:hypothetical protein